jgi:hypothetical protein
MGKALTLACTNAFQIYIYGMRVLRSGKKDKAMTIFVFNQQKRPDDNSGRPWASRVAIPQWGTKPMASRIGKIVVLNVPANLKGQTANYEGLPQETQRKQLRSAFSQREPVRS